MMKSLLAATAVLAIAGSSYVYAQQRFDRQDGDRGSRFEQRHRPSAQDMAAFTDARVAALKAGLELTPDQAKNWPAFEQALRDFAQLRLQRMQAQQAAEQQPESQSPASQSPASPFDRLARRADAMGKASAALKQIADTGAPLYQSLDDAQKGRFRTLARMLRPHPSFAMMRSMEGSRWGEGQRGLMGPRFGGRGFDQQGERGPDGGGMRRMPQGDEDDSRL
jgi:hypothetical protein